MNKSEKERILVDLYYKYIKEGDTNVNQGFIKRVGILGGMILFFFSFGILTLEFIGTPTSYMFLAIFVIILYTNWLDSRYYTDLYLDLIKAVRENKISSFRIYERNWIEKLFYYKMRN